MSSVSNGKHFEKIKLVSFDVWNTLLKGDPRFRPVRISIIAEMLGSLDPKMVEVAATAIDARLDALTEANGEDYGFISRVKAIAAELGIDPGAFGADHYFAMQQRVNDAFALMPPSYIEGSTPALFRNLKARGFKIALLSNTGFINGEAMKKAFAGLEGSECLDTLIFSNEVGIAKPHPQIFKILAERSGIESSATLHIGDSLKADYEGASKSGVRALLYDSEGQVNPSILSIKSLAEVYDFL